jgi:hypothetical protein
MYSVFPIVIFFIGAAVLVGLPLVSTLQSYFNNRGRRRVICPDDRQAAEVEVDPKFALHAAIQGKELARVGTCTHWPENGDCGQECLAQVEATPQNLDRLLTKWLDGKPCNVCGRLLAPADWRFGRMGLLNEDFKLVEMRQLDVNNLGAVAQPTRPLCWSCHQQEKQRQSAPVQIASFERQKLKA